MTRPPRYDIRSSRTGFTLIELLIVVVIIGILAAIAIPKFGSTKEKSYIVTMKSDLRNLVMAQEGYLADNGTYYVGGVPNAALKYQPSSNTTVTIVSARLATLSHRHLRRCARYIVTPMRSAM